eukprot:TRINITY_DN2900_c0_g1_i1.p1 TRINITY_DN2900_c0_g1~~TRINITY_DN2900_c0_g1_i1.p1  ORF type:complete len:486 (+),score=105.90 TRINITY_DN2900_c0_g1_i1:52-1458(+)
MHVQFEDPQPAPNRAPTDPAATDDDYYYIDDGVEFLAPSGDGVSYLVTEDGLVCYVSIDDGGDWIPVSIVEELFYDPTARTLMDGTGIGGVLPAQGLLALLYSLADLGDACGIPHNLHSELDRREEGTPLRTQLASGRVRPGGPPSLTWRQAALEADDYSYTGDSQPEPPGSSSSLTYATTVRESSDSTHSRATPVAERRGAAVAPKDGLLIGPPQPLMWHRPTALRHQSILLPPSAKKWPDTADDGREEEVAWVDLGDDGRLGLLFHDEEYALVVKGADAGTPAATAGLERFEGRLLTKINGYDILDIHDARGRVGLHVPWRDGPLALTFGPRTRRKATVLPGHAEGPLGVTRPLGPPGNVNRRTVHFEQPARRGPAPFSRLPHTDSSPGGVSRASSTLRGSDCPSYPGLTATTSSLRQRAADYRGDRVSEGQQRVRSAAGERPRARPQRECADPSRCLFAAERAFF